MPTFSGCNASNTSIQNQTKTISPGVYCNGITVGNASNVTMSPGTYIVDRGSFDIQGGSTVTGSGVTVVLTSSTGTGYASVDIANGTTVNLTAPSSGPLAGIAMFGDRNAPSSTSVVLAGGATENINGAMYFPSETVNFSNGTTNGGSCTQLIAYKLSFSGGTDFNLNCSSYGTSSIGGGPTTLVE
jgi:hypothetical protein